MLAILLIWPDQAYLNALLYQHWFCKTERLLDSNATRLEWSQLYSMNADAKVYLENLQKYELYPFEIHALNRH